jgi:hypothetical protein
MEVKHKIISFPFWRTVSFGNYMRMNKRLPILERKTAKSGYNNNIYYLTYKDK